MHSCAHSWTIHVLNQDRKVEMAGLALQHSAWSTARTTSTETREARRGETMYHRAMRGQEKALGLEHPSTLGTIHNLDLYSDQDGEGTGFGTYIPALKPIF